MHEVFWKAVRDKERELTAKYSPNDCLFVKSPVGDCVQVNFFTGARGIVEGRWVEASEADIIAFNEHTKQGQAKIDAQELRNSGLSKVIFGIAAK
ncbi:MAG: hypothetical protein ABSG41_26660 [Bryobacteraceae bacterium]|jgi:hypothetical protein